MFEPAVEKHAVIQARLAASLKERAALVGRRAAVTVPTLGGVTPMRRLANELAAARGALDVGFVVTVSPTHPLDVRIRKDETAAESISTERPIEIEAAAQVELDIADIATVRVRGGRRDAQDKARALEDRWTREVVPHLAAAGVTDLDGLDMKMSEAQELDAAIKAKETELRFPARADKHAYRRGGGAPTGFRPRGNLPNRTR